MPRITVAAAVAGLVALTALARTASCDVASAEEYALDPAEMAADTSPPAAIDDVDVSVRRGHVEGAGCSANSDDDIGAIRIAFSPPADDRTAPELIGVRARLVEGLPPKGLFWSALDGPVVPYVTSDPDETHPASVYFNWPDGRTNSQELFAFSIDLIPLDKAGNEGPPTRVVVVDAEHVGGCDVGTSRRWAGLDFVALLLLGVGLTRRRRAQRSN